MTDTSGSADVGTPAAGQHVALDAHAFRFMRLPYPRAPQIAFEAEGGAGAGAAAGSGAAALAGESGNNGGDAGGDKPWYEAMIPADKAEMRTWAAGKKYPDAVSAFEGHMNAEKLIGSNRIALPKDENDKAGWDKVFNQLGRPEQAVGEKGYKLTAPEGVTLNQKLIEQFLPVFHEAGVSQKAAQQIIGKYLEVEASDTKVSDDAAVAKSEGEMRDLRVKWGAAYDEKVEQGRRAAREFGFTEDELSAVESGIGSAKMMERFADIGSRLGEAKFEGRPGHTGFNLTPADAQAQINAKLADPEFSKRWRSENQKVRQTALDELEPLYKLVGGEKPEQKK